MLLKPATPLAVLLLAAFVLLLLSVLSTPVIKSIPLATFQDVHFGVFGYCQGDQCSGFRVGYPAKGIFNDSNKDGDFNLPAAVRRSLSALLIVHPIAAFLAFICFGLAAAAHLHSPSHSPRYLLGLLILLLPTLLVSLLAFLVDILLFVPFLQWGGWIVLGATILLTSSGVVTCAMRRTLVSRKARKRRIAENAEMSGENYYNRQIVVKVDVPPVNGSTSPDQKVPLTTAMPPMGNSMTPVSDADYRGNLSHDRFASTEPVGYPEPPRIEARNDYSGYGPGRQDPYAPPFAAQFNPTLRNQFSNTSVRSNRSDGPMYPPRGRGAYPPRGRGRPFDGPPGFGGNPRVGPQSSSSYRGRGGPPEYRSQSTAYPKFGYGGYAGGPGRGQSTSPRDVDPSIRDQDIEMQNTSIAPRPPARTIMAPHDPSAGDNLKSPTSVYSSDMPYVPPRRNWNQQETLNRDPPAGQSINPSRAMARSPPTMNFRQPGSYYEDAEPQFSLPMSGVESTDVPSALMPGSSGELLVPSSYGNLPDGARSPTASETSYFTSISQRGINPNWQPPDPPINSGRKMQDLLLSNNPDFALPTDRAGANTAISGRMPPPMPTIPGTPPGYRNEGRYRV